MLSTLYLPSLLRTLPWNPLGGDYDSSRGRNGDGGGGSSGTSTSEQQIAEDEEVARQLQQQLLGEEDSTQQQLPQQSARARAAGKWNLLLPVPQLTESADNATQAPMAVWGAAGPTAAAAAVHTAHPTRVPRYF